MATFLLLRRITCNTDGWYPWYERVRLSLNRRFVFLNNPSIVIIRAGTPTDIGAAATNDDRHEKLHLMLPVALPSPSVIMGSSNGLLQSCMLKPAIKTTFAFFFSTSENFSHRSNLSCCCRALRYRRTPLLEHCSLRRRALPSVVIVLIN